MPSSLACACCSSRDQRVGIAQRRARRQLDRHVEAVLRELRDQVGAERRHQQQRQRERGSRGAEHQPALAERGRQQPQVTRVRRGRTAPWPDRSALRITGPTTATMPRQMRTTSHAMPKKPPRAPRADAALDGRERLLQLRRRLPFRVRRLFRERHRRPALQRAQHRDQRHRHDQRDRDRERHRQRLVAEQLAGDALHEHQRQEHRDRRQRRGDDRHADFARAGDRRFEDAERRVRAPWR